MANHFKEKDDFPSAPSRRKLMNKTTYISNESEYSGPTVVSISTDKYNLYCYNKTIIINDHPSITFLAFPSFTKSISDFSGIPAAPSLIRYAELYGHDTIKKNEDKTHFLPRRLPLRLHLMMLPYRCYLATPIRTNRNSSEWEIYCFKSKCWECSRLPGEMKKD